MKCKSLVSMYQAFVLHRLSLFVVEYGLFGDLSL